MGVKKKSAHIFKKRLILIISIVVCVSLICFGGYFLLLQSPICGDGTFYDNCSTRQPYFCKEGVLIEQASICGCAENLTINGDACATEYQAGNKEITLNYVLRGEEETIGFVAYEELANYLSKLPRSIHNNNGETPGKGDFKLKKLNEEEQKYALLPLVTEIQNSFSSEKDKIRMAISLVQNIPFETSEKVIKIGGSELIYARYPYEVLYREKGVCGEKSELLAFILREMGYGVAFLYYPYENHEAVAVKCPKRHSIDQTGYCLIETTGPSIITDNGIEYIGVGKLSSEPELIIVSNGKSIGNFWYEYRDARIMKRLRNGFGFFSERKLEKLQEKYGLIETYNV
jgi:hypothetical protein